MGFCRKKILLSGANLLIFSQIRKTESERSAGRRFLIFYISSYGYGIGAAVVYRGIVWFPGIPTLVENRKELWLTKAKSFHILKSIGKKAWNGKSRSGKHHREEMSLAVSISGEEGRKVHPGADRAKRAEGILRRESGTFGRRYLQKSVGVIPKQSGTAEIFVSNR